MENTFINYSLIILFLPLVAFLIQIFIGKRLPRQGDWVSIAAIVTTLFISIYMFILMLQTYDSSFKQEISQAYTITPSQWSMTAHNTWFLILQVTLIEYGLKLILVQVFLNKGAFFR